MVIAALSLLAIQLQAPLSELDFEMVGGRIYLPAEISGHKTSVIFDSGAGTAVMEIELANRWNLESKGEVPVGGIGKDPVKGKILSGATVTFGGQKSPMRIAIPLASLAGAEGRRLDSIVGYEFLIDHIVEIDYQKKHLRIFDKDAAISTKGFEVPMTVIGNHAHILTEVTVAGAPFSLDTMVDTGASSGGLTARFLAEHPVTVPTTAKAIIGGGVGGMIQGRFFRPESVKIGPAAVSKPILALSDADAGGASGKSSSYDMLLGADILKRFKVTFDYPHKRILFEPNSEINLPFEADKTGLRLFAAGDDLKTYKVVGMLPGSTSAESGILVDDIIETIDGRPTTSLTLQKLRDEFRSPNAKGWNLGVRRGSDKVSIRLEARSVI